jgi:hypothetical protein
MHIGISVITHEGQNIWENGMGQNVLFLARLLQRIDFVESVVLVDVGALHVMPPQVDIAAMGLALVRAHEVTDSLDVVIEMAGALPPEWLALFRACGGRAVYMCVGQPYVGMIEPIVFGDQGSFPTPSAATKCGCCPKTRSLRP